MYSDGVNKAVIVGSQRTPWVRPGIKRWWEKPRRWIEAIIEHPKQMKIPDWKES